MQQPEAVIRVRPVAGGEWETLGSDRYRGIVAEGVEASANPWGPDRLTFTLKREAGPALRADLLPFSDVDLEVGGQLVWAGRMLERPRHDREHSVQCEGWQYHLDDDLVERVYVHTRLADWRDSRTFLETQLANYVARPTVANDQGVIVIGFPNGTPYAAGHAVGVTLDLGPDSTCKRAVVVVEAVNANAFAQVYVRGHDQVNTLGGTVEDYAGAIGFDTIGASTTLAGTVTTARRYVSVFLYVPSASGTTSVDHMLRIRSAKLFRDTAYESGNDSVLKADQVIKNALALAPLLNQSTARIAAGGFSIPEYVTGGYVSPRHVIEAVNVYENYRLKIGGPDLRTLVYDAKPSAPLYEIGEWSGSDVADSSVAGTEIFNRVIVEATGPDGAPVYVKRTQGGTLVDRRGFTRARALPIRSAITQAVGERFGDLWLAEHKTAPFSAKVTAATGGIRAVADGGDIPVHTMLLAAGERLRLAHRVDPDTGAHSRDGRIAAVTYRHDQRQVAIDLDDRVGSFERILARYGVLVDQLG